MLALLLLTWCVAVLRGVNAGDRPNILLILADDLGYGDTSLPPFVGSGIKTPHLEKMAQRGTVMTNFHAAAPICSPSRASILTGLFSWRTGVAGVYEYGKLDGRTNRNDWMNNMPTAAMAFRDAGYYTAHVGKWHLGGMRSSDIDERVKDRQCSHPGPNQQGFTEYVSIAEGPYDPRQGGLLQRSAMLHTLGGKFMLRNDRPHPCTMASLSNCEAAEALRIMQHAKEANQSFYMHVWFEQPHGPWSLMPSFVDWYGGAGQLNPKSRNDCFKTMVSAMDESLGRLLKGLHDLDLEQNTIVLFTSDNGPENMAGTTANFKNRKRFLHEGGLRVPCVWQWPGRIAEGGKIADFGVGVDIYPTFLEAAGVKKPDHVHLDGLSLLPYLAPTQSRPRRVRGEGARALAALDVPERHRLGRPRDSAVRPKPSMVPAPPMSALRAMHTPKASPAPRVNLRSAVSANFSLLFGVFSADLLLHSDVPKRHAELDLASRIWELESRVAMWYIQFEHPISAAAHCHSFKIITGVDHLPIEIYDLANDPYEKVNLIRSRDYDHWFKLLNQSSSGVVTSRKKLFVDFERAATRDERLDRVMDSIMPHLYYFSKYGNAANLLYLKKNFGLTTWPNPENQKVVKLINKDLIGKCAVPNSADVPTLPFEHADHKVHQIVRPLDYFQ